GTDPQEGSALARSIISDLLARGPLVIATTHYSEVKAYAYATPGVENASVEFDLQSLAPTYRLMIGIPGRSNALAIARRLGLDERIVEDARGLLQPDDERAEALIDDIRRRREQLIEQQTRLEQTQQEARALRVRAARALREAEERKREVHAEALAEAEQELGEDKELKRQLERSRHIVPAARPAAATEPAPDIKQAEERLRRFRRERVHRVSQAEQPRELRAGDRVRIEALGQEGEVLSVSDGTAEIQLGPLKVRQPLAALVRVGRRKVDEEQERRPVPAGRPAHVPIEIDFRGQRAADVAEELDRYLHDAYLYGLPWVRIIHGKGTGALRQVVREQLRTHPVVESSESARANEGGDGATVAHLRQT
ncbi:MAG TPA: Smr/MutS family protein, partial [Candidatus Limnocylindria bacterium]|nr:Smr/MutS family protein [Candidatus Limnocylindria bacterium]